MMVLSYPWKYFAKIGTHEIKYELQLGIKRQFCYYETQLYSSIVTFIDQRFKGIFLPVIDCVMHHKCKQKSKIKIRAKGNKSASANTQKISPSSCVQSFSMWDCFNEIAMSASTKSSSLKKSCL